MDANFHNFYLFNYFEKKFMAVFSDTRFVYVSFRVCVFEIEDQKLTESGN